MLQDGYRQAFILAADEFKSTLLHSLRIPGTHLAWVATATGEAAQAELTRCAVRMLRRVVRLVSDCLDKVRGLIKRRRDHNNNSAGAGSSSKGRTINTAPAPLHSGRHR